MSRSLMHRSVLAPVLAVFLAIPTSASAHGPTECVAGPTRLSAADTPHVVDAHGDTSAPYGAVYGNSTDVIGGWISGPSAWADRSSPQNFTATIRVEDLSRDPILARIYVVLQGPDGEQWVRAERNDPTAWTYSYGHMNGTSYATDGTTTGSVDIAAGTMTADIPSSLLPARPADGKALTLDVIAIRSFLRVNAVAQGVLFAVDEASNVCAVTLYEAAPIV
ncbi:MAG: hypothetical protein ACRDHM_09140 [Actinomycetota bacterium]